MTASVSGNAMPNSDSEGWGQASDAAAHAKPQLVDSSKVQGEQEHGCGWAGAAGGDVCGGGQSGLPAAPLIDPLNKSVLQALMDTKSRLPLENAINHGLGEASRGVLHADSTGGAVRPRRPKRPRRFRRRRNISRQGTLRRRTSVERLIEKEGKFFGRQRRAKNEIQRDFVIPENCRSRSH
jgi:hypothetical protein